MESDAVFLVHGADEIAQLRPKNAFQRPALGRDDGDVQVPRAQGGRHLQPDEARADHHRPLARHGARRKRLAVRERAQRERAFRSRNGEPDGIRAGGQEQRAVPERPPGREPHLAPSDVDCGDLDLVDEIDALCGIEVAAAQRHPFLRRSPGEIVLAQVRPIDGRLRADHRDRFLVALPAQLLGAGIARGSGSDDHDALRSGGRPRLGDGEPLPDADATALLLDAIAGDRVAPRPLRRAGAQIVAGVMPRAPDRAALHDALRQWPSVMRADRADGADLAPAPHQDDRFARSMAEELLAIPELPGIETGAEVRTLQLLWRAHAISQAM